MRRLAIACVCLLAMTTVALAATGVILTGAPVRPEESLNPNVGIGIPAPGSSQLLTLRIPDPEGGLPWGMRVVRTTRGEVCLQIARVLGTQLGALGIDGEFHNDGRFHPISPTRCRQTCSTATPSTPCLATRTQAAKSMGKRPSTATSGSTAARAQTRTIFTVQSESSGTSTSVSSAPRRSASPTRPEDSSGRSPYSPDSART